MKKPGIHSGFFIENIVFYVAGINGFRASFSGVF
jgi:hypothetical protein